MNQLIKTGRLLYGIGIAALGIHQLIIKDMRQEIVPAFPAWTHHYLIFPVVTGILLIAAGLIITGLFKMNFASAKNTCLYVAFGFMVTIICCHLPYILFISPVKLSRLDLWFGIGEAFAYCGGALVIAGSYIMLPAVNGTVQENAFIIRLQKLIPLGRSFYALLIILFGYSHFVFPSFVATMVPTFFGSQLFWTYFTGAALIASGVAIILKIWIRPVALLLAVMLFLFFIFFHVPDAIALPFENGGNEIVRATIALLFCGIALVIAGTNGQKEKP
jgi:uncharacterized membrane protein